jgi:DNA-binding NarL/FixJ family response regulator
MSRKSKRALNRRIRVVVADDHPIVREGLGALVKSQKDMQIVSEAENGRQAVKQFFQHRPDVLLLDLRMPEINGIEAARTILERAPDAKVIVLSTYKGDEDVYQALKAGAKAYLLKDASPDELVNCIRSVHAGQVTISPSVSAQLAAGVAQERLTRRERQIMKLLVAGKSNKEIGASLGVTGGTIKVHVGHIFKKLGAGGRTQAIRVALERGLVHLTVL